MANWVSLATKGALIELSVYPAVMANFPRLGKTKIGSGRKTGKTNRKNNTNELGRMMMVVPKQLGFVHPRTRVSLVFRKLVNITQAANTYASIRFAPTNAYDVDPVVGSTSMPGFNEYAALYRFYRVCSSDIHVEFGNKEAFPVSVGICPTNYDVGPNYSGVTTLFAQPECRNVMLGPLTGNSSKSVRASQTTAAFAGARDLGVVDTYTAQVIGGPSNNWYWNLLIQSVSTFTSGVDVAITMTVTLDFLERAYPSA